MKSACKKRGREGEGKKSTPTSPQKLTAHAWAPAPGEAPTPSPFKQRLLREVVPSDRQQLYIVCSEPGEALGSPWVALGGRWRPMAGLEQAKESKGPLLDGTWPYIYIYMYIVK